MGKHPKFYGFLLPLSLSYSYSSTTSLNPIPLRQHALPSNHSRIFIIDGLDECLDTNLQLPDVDKQCEILRCLHYILQQLPSFAVLIASRPEYHIQSMFDTTLKNVSSSPHHCGSMTRLTWKLTSKDSTSINSEKSNIIIHSDHTCLLPTGHHPT